MRDHEDSIAAALVGVRRRLRGHGGDIDVAVSEDGTARVDFKGACRACPAIATTFAFLVKPALREAGASDVVSSQVRVSQGAMDRMEQLSHTHIGR